jgi:hypothetical protein
VDYLDGKGTNVLLECVAAKSGHYGTLDLLAPAASDFIAAMQGHPTKITVPRIGEVLVF